MGKPGKTSRIRGIHEWARLARQRWSKDAEAERAFLRMGFGYRREQGYTARYCTLPGSTSHTVVYGYILLEA